MVAQGETIDSIARRHGVPASAILQANNMTHAAQLRPGQRLVIPRVQQQQQQHAAPGAAGVAARDPRRGTRADPGQPQRPHRRARRDDLFARAPLSVTPMAIAKANNIAPRSSVKIGDRIIIPGLALGRTAPRGSRTPRLRPRGAAATANAAHRRGQARSAGREAGCQLEGRAQRCAAERQSGDARGRSAARDAPTGTTGSSSASFRWPVNGRVIAGFGPKPNGQQNDGINIAVPEGTPIKAAEDGVVAYAGNELKGYGNLVLVRHSNGFVTAYAHASEMLVKRGETVKRGQVIAQGRPDRQRHRAATALRNPQGRDAGRSDAVSDRRLSQQRVSIGP